MPGTFQSHPQSILQRSAQGHEDPFPRPMLSVRFSIAANVKTHPDHLVLRVGLPVTAPSTCCVGLAKLRQR